MPTVIYENFEWDEAKDLINQQKHNISFQEACFVFNGDFDQEIVYHPLSKEIRFLTTGIFREREIVVIWTHRGFRRRIISARKARKDEQQRYRNRRRA